MLTYGPFNAVSSFVLAAKGGPPLKQGAHGPAVALLQGALIDLGITVTDAFMAEFHRQGMAQHFDCVGSIRRKLSWRSGEAIPEVQLASAGGR